MKRDVLKATATIFTLTLVAKIIAFLKSILQASCFGATIETDAFNLSNGFVGNILYMITTALAVSFVPLYIQQKKISKEAGKSFATKSATILFFSAIILTVLLVIITPAIIKIIAPLYEGEAFDITVEYFRVLCIGISFSLVTNLFSNLLNAEKVYGFSTMTSIVNSFTLIFMIVVFSKSLGVWSLVLSVPLSFFIQSIVLYWRSKNYISLSFTYGVKDRSINLLFLQALPILISQATVEVNQVVDRTLLTTVATGVVTAVSYSAILYQFAQSLVAAPLSTVIFTELSEAAANSDKEQMGSILNTCYRILFLICIPIVVVIFFCSQDIVTIVYGHGAFSKEAIDHCSVGLAVYGFCLLPTCTKTVLCRAYYSLNDTRRPMIISILEVALNIGLSILLVKPFGIVGVVGATAIASIVFIIVMLIDYNVEYYKVLTGREILNYWKPVLCGVFIIVLFSLLRDISFYNSLINFITKSLLAFVCYFGSLIFLKDSTMLVFVNSIAKRLHKT